MASLKAEKREGKGKYVSFALRKEGRLPGVIYGKGMDKNVNVSVDLKDFLQLLKAGDRIIDLQLGGSSRHVLIKAVQHGTYDHEILHVDFRAISENETIDVELEIELKGDAAGTAVGGLVEQNLYHIHARCLPRDLPEKVILDITNLKFDQIIYVEDLPKLPGVEYIYHGNSAVVSCHPPRGETAAEEGGEVHTAPEVIGEKEREAREEGK